MVGSGKRAMKPGSIWLRQLPASREHFRVRQHDRPSGLSRYTVAVGQHVCGDLAGAGAHAQVQLEPPSAEPAVLGRAPLALAEQLKPCAVQNEVDRAAHQAARAAVVPQRRGRAG